MLNTGNIHKASSLCKCCGKSNKIRSAKYGWNVEVHIGGIITPELIAKLNERDNLE